ncbi:methyltransferase [Streptomyces sp. NPDC058657]|uniref:class I SAM-dependent methyltransferase n=1 Tax=unclassified Streptomyces TaxID=2593676 RepID=UPI00365760CD
MSNAETARANAETARATTETARPNAGTARANARTARPNGETAQPYDEAARLLARHDQVAEAVTAGPVAYVVPGTRAGTAHAEKQVDEWQELYDRLYAGSADAAFGDDFVGWNSSYDRRPIPLEEMRQWQDTTVRRIRELRPRRILEIGAGSGLLLAPLLDDCEEYWATDLSQVAVDELARHLAADPARAARVHLRAQGADRTDGLPTGHFDTVVLNSVAQLFPGAAYLDTVIRQVLTLLAPGGAFFLGDIRDLRTRDHLHTAVVLGRGTATGCDAVRRAVGKAQAREEELLVHPDYFTSLARTEPGVAGVDVQLKRGGYHNELSRHRYDVVLRKAPASHLTDLTDCPRLAWGAPGVQSTAALEEHLSGLTPPLRITGIPNSRLTGEAAALRAVTAGGPDAVTVGRRRLTATDEAAVDPHQLTALAARHGLDAHLAPAPDRPEYFEAVLVRPGTDISGSYRHSGESGPLTVVPAAAHRADTLVTQLHAWLRARLPEHALPERIVAVDALPDTARQEPVRLPDTAPQKSVPARTAAAARPHSPLAEEGAA